ncbi:unnamed protein product [Closterium sp. NIES-53]
MCHAIHATISRIRYTHASSHVTSATSSGAPRDPGVLRVDPQIHCIWTRPGVLVALQATHSHRKSEDSVALAPCILYRLTSFPLHLLTSSISNTTTTTTIVAEEPYGSSPEGPMAVRWRCRCWVSLQFTSWICFSVSLLQMTLTYQCPDILVPVLASLNPLVESIIQADMDRFVEYATKMKDNRPVS